MPEDSNRAPDREGSHSGRSNIAEEDAGARRTVRSCSPYIDMMSCPTNLEASLSKRSGRGKTLGAASEEETADDADAGGP